MFEVIKGVQKPKVNKHDLYYQAYCRVLNEYKDNPEQDIKPIMKRLITYGVRYINLRKQPEHITQEDLEYNFNVIEVLKCLMANLTPGEFVNLFPIMKDYDGEKWQTKDYFYTMNYIKGLNQSEPIGTEIDNFLWEYHNWTISHFVVNTMGIVSDLRKLQGEPGLMEEWAEENGLKTYTMHTDTKGKQYMTDNQTGKSMRVKKHIPRYLKTVK